MKKTVVGRPGDHDADPAEADAHEARHQPPGPHGRGAVGGAVAHGPSLKSRHHSGEDVGEVPDDEDHAAAR